MKTIAIASKDVESRNEIARVLQRDDWHFVRFASGQAILDYIQSNPGVSIAIVDNDLEGSNGKEVVKAIRGELGLVDLPVVIVSKMIRMRYIGEFLDLGASYFVPKPIKPDLLRGYIEILLQKTGNS